MLDEAVGTGTGTGGRAGNVGASAWARTAWPVARQAWRDVWANNLMEWAAALAFYAVLSVFPLLLAAVALAAYVVEPGWAAARLGDLLDGFVPPGVLDLDAVVDAAVAERRRVGLLAIAAWLFAGRRILGALVTALDRVSDVDAREESWRRRVLVEVVLLGGLGALFAAALSAGALVDLAWGAAGRNGGSALADAAGAVLHALLLVAGFYALYAFVPRGERSRRAALLGAVVAAALFLVARTGFRLAAGWLWDSFGLVYGPIALAALLLAWAWYVGMVVLFGGSLASHAKAMLVEGRTAEDAERRHVARKAGEG